MMMEPRSWYSECDTQRWEAAPWASRSFRSSGLAMYAALVPAVLCSTSTTSMHMLVAATQARRAFWVLDISTFRFFRCSRYCQVILKVRKKEEKEEEEEEEEEEEKKVREDFDVRQVKKD